MRRLAILALGTALGVAGLAPAALAAEPAKASSWKAPRNAMGQPDFSGVWSNATVTPLTRSPRISNKAVLSPEEGKAFEKLWADALAAQNKPSDPNETPEQAEARLKSSKLLQLNPIFGFAAGDTGGYNTFWIDPGVTLIQIDGQYRTSILTTENGMPPPRKGAKPGGGFGAFRDIYDSYETRPGNERCLDSFGRNAPPPMLPNGFYNNNYQILQTPDAVVINVEMIHDARIIRLNGQHRTDGLRPMMGDSIGRFEGDTLVVETTNFPESQDFMGSWKNLKVTEWFTRISANQILYKFQIEDPDSWDKPWGGEYTFNTLNGRVFEYACHEGNYALRGILGGAREKERQDAAAAAAAKGKPAGGGD